MNEIAKTTLLKIIAGVLKPTSGEIKYGSTVKVGYFAKNHDNYFNQSENLIDFLRKYSENKEESFVRGFLGRMLFSGEEAMKNISVLSGGEKVRLMFSKLMLEKNNVLLFDEPTNHLDIESITALNEGLERYKSSLIISTFDQEIIESVCNRLIEIKKDGTIRDKYLSFSEYIEKFGIEE